MNIITDGTYLISGIYTKSNEIDDYRLVFIISISLLHKILNACKN